MLQILRALPDGFFTLAASDLHRHFRGPTMIHLDGERTPAVFVSILLHGNEDVGLKAIQQALSRYAGKSLPRELLLFIGNVEARDVYRGQADVVVCDGFTGTVALKISEGLVELIEGLLNRELSLITDGPTSGGAPLLGVNGVTIVGHGRSSANAVRNAVVMAHRLASDQVVQRIEHDIAASAVPHQ